MLVFGAICKRPEQLPAWPVYPCVGLSRSGRSTRTGCPALGKNYAQDFSKIAGRYTLYGKPDDCRKRLKEYMVAGARTVLVSRACRQNDTE
jgi:hypothetical protein